QYNNSECLNTYPKVERRSVVKYRTPEDEGLVLMALGDARQRMDILNERAIRMWAIPMALMYFQLKHYYQGAYLHKELVRRGHPAVFPTIVDEKGVLEIDDILPIRMVCNAVARGRSPEFAYNSFSLTPDQRVIQVEGPNKRGKSEAWRTLHLMNPLVNAGYPVPARDVRLSVVPNSHFISCKGDRGHGGSELERSLRGIRGDLKEVHPGDTVILDELGDATNAPTALEIARRLLPVLAGRGCRVFVTSHHDALTSFIAEELGGISFMPDPSGEGVNRYVLMPSSRNIDFKPTETLDELDFTAEHVGEKLPTDERLCARRRDPRHEPDYDDEIVF
ncbi:hypothetical protein ACFL0V_01890, partial [Nanoarchaeota archaeon]